MLVGSHKDVNGDWPDARVLFTPAILRSVKRRIAYVTFAALALAASAAALACDGDDDGAAPSATASATVVRSSTPASTRIAPTRAATSAPSITPEPTLPPAPTRPPPTAGGQPIVFSEGRTLLDSDLAARGAGEAGRGAFNIERIIIRDAAVDAPVSSAAVSAEGRMFDPPSLDVVVWYDFSAWSGLGGLPNAGGNVVMAGDAYKPTGIGVFAGLVSNVAIGSFVRLQLSDATDACYRIEFIKYATPEQFSALVSATAEESITLITGGVDQDRAVVWGRRAGCAAEPATKPTPAPRAGHHKLKIVAENLTFTVVEGGVVPLGTHTVDFEIDHRDAGVEHSIAFYDTTGRELIATDAVVGPLSNWGGPFGVGPPQPPGQYTFRCSIHPQMTGAITVLP